MQQLPLLVAGLFRNKIKMTPKQKALELYNKFRDENSVMTSNIIAKKQAFICIKEIIDLMIITLKWDEKTNGNIIFWQDVFDEMERL